MGGVELWLTARWKARVEILFSVIELLMAALWNRAEDYIFPCDFYLLSFLWPPYVADAGIIFLPCGFFLLSSFFLSSPTLSGRRLDVYHTSTHGVDLVRI